MTRHDDTGHGPCPDDHGDEWPPLSDVLFIVAAVVLVAAFAGLLLAVSR